MQPNSEQLNGGRLKGFAKWLYSCLLTRKAKMSVTASGQLHPQTPDAWNIYQSCDDLPLTVFITCLANNDLSGLIRDGNPPIAFLQDAWVDLYSDYCDRIGGIQIASMIDKTRTINALSSKLQRITTLVDCARIIRHDLITAELLCEPGLKVSKSNMLGTEEQYLRELDTMFG